ncbi:hypothetical protein L5515_002504 [Caenorhabditis briggsae]|uniref:BTB domain-containing protein n=1 Tax=Caenorhabditis briggsae TaxID=6238 RepID=A0AAE9J4X6_CAEBR|nr:hypothetical protein L5515_002504 [Caenorhabditis briggsae]
MKLVSKYRNEELTEKLISEIKTLKEYKSIVADGVDDFSLDISTATQEIKTTVHNLEKQVGNVSKTILEKIEKIESRMDRQNSSKKSPEKTFVLKETFKDVLTMREGDYCDGKCHEHFGQNWFLGIKRNEDYLLAYLALKKKPNAEKIYVETSQEISISVENRDRISKTVENRFKSGGVLMYRLLTWKDMEQRYVRDGGVHLEIGVKVNKMEGPIRSKFHQFGVSNEKFSNVILNVDGQKFYVLKELLSMHSSYFEKLFTGGFQESEKPEVTLKEVDPQHFQIFLELIHGYSALDDSTVEGILLLNDIYDAKIVRENCIAFFMEGSDMTAAKKLQLASRYQIDGLAKKTISEIKNAEEYRSLVAEGKDDFSPPILKALLDKALTFTIL